MRERKNGNNDQVKDEKEKSNETYKETYNHTKHPQ